jgi:Tol biopolymer transport system component
VLCGGVLVAAWLLVGGGLTTSDAAFKGHRGLLVYVHIRTGYESGVGRVYTGGIVVKRPNAKRATAITSDPTDRDPVFSPDGGTIAFVRAGDLMLMNDDGSNVRPLTHPSAEDSQPAFSPDGQWVVFTRNDPGVAPDADIYRIGIDGTDERRLTDAPGADTEPAVSPDGKRIAFRTTRNLNRHQDLGDIFVMSSDGYGERPLVQSAESEGSPSFSPDGRSMVFIRRGRVLIGSSHGKQIRRLSHSKTVFCPEGDYRCANPSFSPDGHRVLFTDSSFDFFDIESLRVTGGGFRIFANATSDEDGFGDAVFSPDWQSVR